MSKVISESQKCIIISRKEGVHVSDGVRLRIDGTQRTCGPLIETLTDLPSTPLFLTGFLQGLDIDLAHEPLDVVALDLPLQRGVLLLLLL